MTTASGGLPEVLARELAIEQAHVDRVYTELDKAMARTEEVHADGLARGRATRSGDLRDEELTGLFERDAMVYQAAKRRHELNRQYEGLVFGRLDLGQPDTPPAEREVRYVGRLGVRDDDYEPLVVDWRAPAASAFYRATAVDPLGVLRRRVLRSSGSTVIGIEDDLMVAQAPDGLVIVGDGALMAALTRSRGAHMQDIVATIQRHQDEAIRAPSRGVTEITGGPGTGKTVVALHRAAYLLYAERRRFEHGGVLVIGPSAAYTAYIERVLPSLGEDSVSLRSIGDVVDGVTAVDLDDPAVAAVKGSARMADVLSRVALQAPQGSPEEFRAFVGGTAIRIGRRQLDAIRFQARRGHPHNLAVAAARAGLADAAWRQHAVGEREDFMESFAESPAVDDFMDLWWPQLDPREPLLWLADSQRLAQAASGLLSPSDQHTLAVGMQRTLERGEWSVADVALIDELWGKLGPRAREESDEGGFYDIEELDNLSSYGVYEVSSGAEGRPLARSQRRRRTDTPLERLLAGEIERPSAYAHILVDEAQDLSPMQWRMVARRGRSASWTVVGDAAQASWPDAAEAARARDEAFGSAPRRSFHMATNYRNAREVFDYAAATILPVMPDADIPDAVRVTGHDVREVTAVDLPAAVASAIRDLATQVEGSIAIITPARHGARLAPLGDDRVIVIDPLSSKGLEWDATVVVDPDEIVATSPGGPRALYVALTRAAHRMTLVRPAADTAR